MSKLSSHCNKASSNQVFYQFLVKSDSRITRFVATQDLEFAALFIRESFITFEKMMSKGRLERVDDHFKPGRIDDRIFDLICEPGAYLHRITKGVKSKQVTEKFRFFERKITPENQQEIKQYKLFIEEDSQKKSAS